MSRRTIIEVARRGRDSAPAPPDYATMRGDIAAAKERSRHVQRLATEPLTPPSLFLSPGESRNRRQPVAPALAGGVTVDTTGGPPAWLHHASGDNVSIANPVNTPYLRSEEGAVLVRARFGPATSSTQTVFALGDSTAIRFALFRQGGSRLLGATVWEPAQTVLSPVAAPDNESVVIGIRWKGGKGEVLVGATRTPFATSIPDKSPRTLYTSLTGGRYGQGVEGILVFDYWLADAEWEGWRDQAPWSWPQRGLVDDLLAVKQVADAGRVISADWFSDLNAAIFAAGKGGTIRFSPNTIYEIDDPLRVVDGLIIEGAGRWSTTIKYSGSAGIRRRDPVAELREFQLRNIALTGNKVGGVGIDARGFTRCHFFNVGVRQPASVGVWWGGDGGNGGWTNVFDTGDVSGSATGPAMRFRGTAGSGAPTANNITVRDVTIQPDTAGATAGIVIDQGDDNLFTGLDMGYHPDAGSVISIEGAGKRNRFIGNRTEAVKQAVRINGGSYNMFIANVFGLSPSTDRHGAEILGGAASFKNVFRDNWWSDKGLSPAVWEQSSASQTIIDDLTEG